MSVQILRVSPLSSRAFILGYDTAEERCEETTMSAPPLRAILLLMWNDRFGSIRVVGSPS